MTGPALILLIVSILIIWGGLIGSIIALNRVPAPFEAETEGAASPANLRNTP